MRSTLSGSYARHCISQSQNPGGESTWGLPLGFFPRRVVRVLGHAPVIEYEGVFAFPVGVDRVWETIGRSALFPSWWGWLREFSVEGHDLARGTVFHGVVVPPLPYRMRLDVAVDECVPRDHITAFVHGDLEGTAILTFAGDEAKSVVGASWVIEMMQPPMRMAARFAHPLLQWGHDCVVEATVDGFRRHLLDGDPH
jgi:hypothetical protein